jgi:EAL domain-containing protein (putative c-di-GMP-specific phosphodiesterase class I)
MTMVRAPALPTPSATNFGATVLVVDDDRVSRTLHSRLMTASGYSVLEAADGMEALAQLSPEPDLILSDITMPRLDGVALLRRVATEHPDLPVILLTGNPDLRSAIAAVEFGAHRYLIKPVDPAELQNTVAKCLRLRRLAKLRREAAGIRRDETISIRRDGLGSRLGLALAELQLVWQPMFDTADSAVAFEGCLRTPQPGLRTPGEVLQAANSLDVSHELGRAVRRVAAQSARSAPPGSLIFVNMQASDLLDPELVDARAPLSAHAGRVVLELTEQTSSEGIHDLSDRLGRLRALGYRIALDDLGSGYASLSLFATLDPEFVKIDMSLVRNIHRAPHKMQLARSLAAVFKDMGKVCIAEGVEAPEERDALREAGFDWLQGFLLGRPAEGFEITR